MEQFGLAIQVKTLALLVFYLTSMVFIIFSVIMYYHWNSYSPDSKVSKITLILYLGTNIPLLIALGITTLII